MSLELNMGTRPKGLSAQTSFGVGSLYLGDYEISLADFLQLARYVLTNTDLSGPDDPRLRFVAYVREMGPIDGYNPGGTRLTSPGNPSFGS